MKFPMDQLSQTYDLIASLAEQNKSLFDQLPIEDGGKWGVPLGGVFHALEDLYSAVALLENVIDDEREIDVLVNAVAINAESIPRLVAISPQILKEGLNSPSTRINQVNLVGYLKARHLHKNLTKAFDTLLKKHLHLAFSSRIDLLPIPLLLTLKANSFMVSEMLFPKEQMVIASVKTTSVDEHFQRFLFIQPRHASAIMQSDGYPELKTDYYWSFYCRPTVDSVNAYAAPAQIRRKAKAFYQEHDPEFATALETCIRYLMKLDGLKLRNAINTLYAIFHHIKNKAQAPIVMIDHLERCAGDSTNAMIEALHGVSQENDAPTFDNLGLNVTDEIIALLSKAPDHIRYNTLRYLQGQLAQSAA